MKFHVKRFYNSTEDLRQFHFQLKQTTCPHCKSIGSLNLHGYLRGYDDKECRKKIIRGRRLFCCNRNRRKGCGRTFSILAASVIKKFIISAESLWHFLKNILKGYNKIHAFKAAGIPFAESSCYRLWKIFRLHQTSIRSKLLRLFPTPVKPTQSPPMETILHLRCAFKDTAFPITAYQNQFQASFL